MRRSLLLSVGLLAAASIGCAAGALAAEPTAEQAQFFESKIRPILVENCQKCHGEKKQSGQLRLDSAAGLLAGGESGAAVEPGHPEKSLLVEAVNYASLEMPPDAKLKPEQIKLLTEWVKLGAPWPGSGDVALAPRKGGLVVTEEDREWWAFRPIVGHSLREWPFAKQASNSIDAFVFEKLAEKGLLPSPPAEARHLIRRAYFDFVGLPPTAEQIAAFAADKRPDAFERVVDRLLAMPQHGERWGRHWLDIVRFAQSNGYERDSEKALAWRYRDYVIRALNADKPYDQFLIEQLAGDELTPVTDDSLSATGYYRLGPWDDEPDDGKQAKADELDDIVSTTASAMLGLTLGCARCHDHKFDPLGQEDYFSFTAFFQNIHLFGKVADVVGGGQPVDKEGIFRPLPSGGGETLCVRERDTAPPQTFVHIRGDAHAHGKEVRPRFVEVLTSTAEAMIPKLPEAVALLPNSRGRRLTLANWIASSDNPLTARVAVNRLWKYHFGRGIVATPSDFGKTGLAPTHPELLDYLASELVAGNWELKRLHRKIAESATYRQASKISDLGFGIGDLQEGDVSESNPKSQIPNPKLVDPDNTLLWRQNLRRLEAEAIRDAVLAASGELNLQMGGRGIFPALPPEVLAKQSRPGAGWDKSPAADQARRSVYIFVKRTLGVPLLESFDVASPDSPIAQRSTTTVAPQALILLNSDFLQEQAAALADRVTSSVPATLQVAAAYRFALGREPTVRERIVALAFLERETKRWSELKSVEAVAAADRGEQLLGWQQFEGQWRRNEDGGCRVERHPGAKIVREGLSLEDGAVEAQVMLSEDSGDAGLIVRVGKPASGTNALKAYNINLRKGSLRLGKHENNWRQLAAVKTEVAANQWHDVKVELEGGRIRVWLDGAEEPQIDYTDDEPLAAGSVGFRTFNVGAAVRQIRVTRGDKVEDVPMEYSEPAEETNASATPAERALTELCKLLLNLNEFVYID